MKARKAVFALGIASTLATFGLAYAQEPVAPPSPAPEAMDSPERDKGDRPNRRGKGPRGENGPGMEGRRGMGGPNLMGKLQAATQLTSNSQEQSNKLRELTESVRENQKAMQEEIKAKREEMKNATDPKAARKEMAEQLRAKQEEFAKGVNSQLDAILTPEQKAELDKMPKADPGGRDRMGRGPKGPKPDESAMDTTGTAATMQTAPAPSASMVTPAAMETNTTGPQPVNPFAN